LNSRVSYHSSSNCLAAALETLEAGKTSADAAADITIFTSTEAYGLWGHVLNGAGLLRADASGVLHARHLLNLRLGGLLGRHFDVVGDGKCGN